jgi:hypothetical protein
MIIIIMIIHLRQGFGGQCLRSLSNEFYLPNMKRRHQTCQFRKIIEKHNGIISASSRENEGAKFVIVLPLRQEIEAGVQMSEN